VPIKDRLTSCSLVNRRLHAAAVAATQEITLVKKPKLGMQWLFCYGQQATKLSMDLHTEALLQLPCSNLCELQLNFCSVQLGPTASGETGVVQGSVKLTRLELNCHIMDGPTVDSLSRLVHLQHLHVHPLPTMVKQLRVSRYHLEGLSSAMLPCLKQLTYLHAYSLAADNLPQLGSLTRLQQLFCRVSGDVVVGPSTVPCLVFPASLISLDVVECRVEVGVLSLLPTGLKGLRLGSLEQPLADGADVLLTGVARQQHMTRLDITCSEHFAWPAVGPAYAALTANITLVELTVVGMVPEGALQHVFPAQHQLPHLTHLQFDDFQSIHVHEGEVVLVPPPVWIAADLLRLVCCCPNLRLLVNLSV
jgi:hypothetical protein